MNKIDLSKPVQMYQLHTSAGEPFGSPMRDADTVLQTLGPKLRPILAKLGMRVRLRWVYVS